MPWWSWILIWIALIALSLLFFGVLGVRLYRQFTATMNELSDAADKLSGVPALGDPDAVPTAPGNAAASPGQEPGDAVFASPARMRHDYHASKVARQSARRLRRIQRKKDRGQPQALRDIELG
jgi:hypothetical protein